MRKRVDPAPQDISSLPSRITTPVPATDGVGPAEVRLAVSVIAVRWDSGIEVAGLGTGISASGWIGWDR
jgi:hypothetical protein